jgi:acetyl esterase/lipase
MAEPLSRGIWTTAAPSASLLEGAGARVVSLAYPLPPFPRPLEAGYAVLLWAYKQRTRLAGPGRSAVSGR